VYDILFANSAARRRALGSTGPAGLGEFAADELVAEFNLSWQAAAEQIAFACSVAERLPRTFAALAAGPVHPVHVRIIEDETRFLAPQDAARADEVLAEAARSKSFGQLRYAAHRLVLRLDPESALRRKEQAKQDAHVRRFREDSGNAGMVARELPADEILASWQHVEQRALDLRTAGMPGTLQELRVQALPPVGASRPCARTAPPPRTAALPAGTRPRPGLRTRSPPARTASASAPRPAPGRGTTCTA